MAYALHRRAAFRQSAPASGWAFNLANSSYLNAATLLNTSIVAGGGAALRPYRIFLSSGSSSLIAQGVNINAQYRLFRYDFPENAPGDIQRLQNSNFTIEHDSSLGYRPVAFSPDGRHFACQGRGTASATSNIIYSCMLGSPFDISSISAAADMSSLSELTGEVPGLAFSSDGMQLIVLGTTYVRSYYLQNAFDVSSASLVYTQVALTRFTASCGISAVVSHPEYFRDLQFSPDGRTLVLLWSYGVTSAMATGVFFVFKLSVPYNLSTLSLDHVWDIGTNYVNYFTIDPAGANLYVARDTTVLQYTLSA